MKLVQDFLRLVKQKIQLESDFEFVLEDRYNFKVSRSLVTENDIYISADIDTNTKVISLVSSSVTDITEKNVLWLLRTYEHYLNNRTLNSCSS
jgi:hypothetical protein